MEGSVVSGKKKTGRSGMHLWHILVLGVVRMTLDTNYDRLWDIANHHKLVRQIMGIESSNGFKEFKEIPYNTIRENVGLLDEETINKISLLVVKAGHQIVKKKEEKLKVKVDTYVMESNVHFPSDISLLWDSARKSIDIMIDFEKKYQIGGWRKAKDWYRNLKNQLRSLSKTCQSGGKDKEKKEKEKATEYLRLASKLNEKIVSSKETICKELTISQALLRLMELDYYHSMLTKHIDLVERRLIKGETIPHTEKLFSIFEPHAEWIKKGKANDKVEIGHNILVATDQFDFILMHKVIEKQADVELSVPLTDSLLNLYKDIFSISFDKGFWKKENKELLQLFIEKVIMPKKGRKNKTEQEEESSKEFKKLRNKHSAIESNINSIEHHGLNRCPDKGKKSFIRYAAVGVLAYNLHRLGMVLIAQQEKKQQKEQRRKAA